MTRLRIILVQLLWMAAAACVLDDFPHCLGDHNCDGDQICVPVEGTDYSLCLPRGPRADAEGVAEDGGTDVPLYFEYTSIPDIPPDWKADLVRPDFKFDFPTPDVPTMGQDTAPPDAPLAEEIICDDAMDNDGDDLIDCADPDCNCLVVEICDNGADDDGDDLVDCADPDCPLDTLPCAEVEVCGDAFDNDGDGLMDCEDEDCLLECAGSDCSMAIVTDGSGTFEVDSSSFSDAHVGSCGGDNGREAVFEIELIEDANLHLDTEGSDFDTIIYVRSGVCEDGEMEVPAGCNDDIEDGVGYSSLDLLSLPAGIYYIFIDAYSFEDPFGGNVVLSVDVVFLVEP